MLRRDILTPLGIIFGFAVIFISIYLVAGYDGLLGFVSISSLFIVLGGLSASILVAFGAREIKNMFIVIHTTYRRKELDLEELIQMLVELSKTSRTEGSIRGLEKRSIHLKDPFIKKGIQLIVDGYSSEMIRQVMGMDITALKMRHDRGQQIMRKSAELSPAWGMIGTIIGLVIMLREINNPEAIGPAVAVALITTFYGILLANLVFNPIAHKLEWSSEEEILLKEVVVEALVSIRNNEGPSLLRNKLHMYLTNDMYQSLPNEDINVEADEELDSELVETVSRNDG